MALFVLREGFQVETTESGGRVVHKRTGDALDLSAPEVQLLARATTGGVDTRDPGYRPLVKKLARLGLLVQAPASNSGPAADADAEGSAEEGGFELTVEPEATPDGDQKVPLFRRDLTHARTSQSLVEVTDPVSNKVFTLYYFELSLARMLDGLRTWNDVVASGQRLGIPVNLESLGQFIRQLRRYGFLGPEGANPDEAGPRPPREQWDESLRMLFQSGLRMNRQGRYAEAAGYFEAMLNQDPDNLEAQEMLAQVRQRLSPTQAAAASRPSVADPLDAPLVELLFDAEPELPVPQLEEPAPAATPPASSEVEAAWSQASAATEGEPEQPAADEAGAVEVSIEVEAGEESDVPAWSTDAFPPAAPVVVEETPAEPSAPVSGLENLFDVEPKALIESEKARAATDSSLESVVLGPQDGEQSDDSGIEVAIDSAPSSPTNDLEAAWEAAGDELSQQRDAAPARRSAGSRVVAVLGMAAGLALAAGGGWYLGFDAGRKAGRAEAGAVAVAARSETKPAVDAKKPADQEPPAEPAEPAVAAAPSAAAAEPAGEKPAAPVAADEPADDEPVAAADDVDDADEAEPEPDVDEAEPAAAIADSAKPSTEASWSEFEIDKRGRVTMCSIAAPASGSVSWEAAPRQRLRRRQAAGSQAGKPIVMPCAGLLIPRVADGEGTASGAEVADVVYHEGFLQTVVTGEKPTPEWRCEVIDSDSLKSTECKVVKAVPRGDGFFLTATFEPMWVDDSRKPRLRLAP